MAIAFLRMTGSVKTPAHAAAAMSYFGRKSQCVAVIGSVSPARMRELLRLSYENRKRSDGNIAQRVVIALPREWARQQERQAEFVSDVADEILPAGNEWTAFLHCGTDGKEHAHLMVLDRPLGATKRPAGLYRRAWCLSSRRVVAAHLRAAGLEVDRDGNAPGRHHGPVFRRGTSGYVSRVQSANTRARLAPAYAGLGLSASGVLSDFTRAAGWSARKSRWAWADRDEKENPYWSVFRSARAELAVAHADYAISEPSLFALMFAELFGGTEGVANLKKSMQEDKRAAVRAMSRASRRMGAAMVSARAHARREPITH